MKRWVFALLFLVAPAARADPTTDAGPSQVDAELRKFVREGRYEFCRNPHYRLDRAELRLCAFADSATERCPALKKACQNRVAEPERKVASSNPSVGSEMSMLARVLFWGALVGGLGLLGVFALRSLAARRREAEAACPPPPAPDDTVSAKVAPRVTDVERLLELAEAAAAAERSDEAIVLSHAALLRHLEQQGHLRLDPSFTNGEYVRAMGEHPGLERVLRSVTAAVDRVQFGAWTGTLEAFRALHLEVVAAVKAGALLGLVFCLLASTTACSADNRVASPDTSPDGHGLLRQLLAEHGFKSHRRVRELDRVPAEVGTVIVLAPQSDGARQVLLDWAREGGTVLFADGGGSAGGCTAPLELAPEAGLGSAEVGGPLGATLSSENPEARTVIECGDRPYLTTEDFGDGRLLNLAEEQFLGNASLLVGDNAWVLLTLLGETQGEVEIIDRFTGTAAATPLQAVARGKLTPLVAQLLLLLAVAALWRGVAFGTLRDPPALSRRSFAEHVRAVGQAYAKARATRLVLANYGGWALERLRERTQPGHGASLDALAQAVAARTGRSETDVRAVLEQVRIALDDPHPTATSWQDLATMRQLEALVSKAGVSR